MKIPGNISELYEYAEQTGTHIPKYPFRAGYLRVEYNGGWLADDYGKTPNNWFEQLEKAKEQYGDVNIITYEMSDLKKWIEKKSDRRHEISDLKVALRRCGITRQDELHELTFDEIDALVRNEIMKKEKEELRKKAEECGKKNITLNDKDKEKVRRFIDISDRFLEQYKLIEEYFHKMDTCAQPSNLVNVIWWPTLLKKDSPIPAADLFGLSGRVVYDLESIRTVLCFLFDADIVTETIEKIKDAAQKIGSDFKSIRNLYLESHEKHSMEDWMMKYYKEGKTIHQKFVNLLHQKRRFRRMEQAGIISKAIDELGLRELAKGCEQPKSKDKKAETLTPNDKQSETYGVKKKIDLKDREPLEFNPLSGIIEILIQERLAEKKTLVDATKDEVIIDCKDITESNPAFPQVINDALVKQTEKLSDFLEYMKKVKATLKKKNDTPGDRLIQVDDLIDWTPVVGMKMDSSTESVDKSCGRLIIDGPFSFYIKQKYETLSKLHCPNNSCCHSVNFNIIDTSTLIKDMHGIKTVELLQRQFEKGSEQYPSIKHRIMTWPFMYRMPKPPRETINEQIQKLISNPICQYNRLMICPKSFTTSKTLSYDWFDGPESSMKGLQRFIHLAQEAGQIFFNDYMETNSAYPIVMLKPLYLDRWIYLMHSLRFTYISNDGWDGLFDGDVDLSEEGLKEGLYTFRESEDIFLDSAFTCNLLLNGHSLNKKGDNDIDSQKQNETAVPVDIVQVELDAITKTNKPGRDKSKKNTYIHMRGVSKANKPSKPLNEKRGFVFGNGVVSYNNTEIPIPAGDVLSILKKLVDCVGNTVIFKDLRNDCVKSASDQLRGDISKINKILECNGIPYLIKSKRAVGYSLIAKK